MTPRLPRKLLFALLGEHVWEIDPTPVRAAVLLRILGGAGVQAPAARATLDRAEQSGIVDREKRGREILFRLTRHGHAVLTEATPRVRDPQPFHTTDDTWTLVTFALTEDRRALRHRLRAMLTWHGFAAIRDGLWIAPGRKDVVQLLRPLADALAPGEVTAFHADDVRDFPVAARLSSTWNISDLRAAHDAFAATWTAPLPEAVPASSLLTMLVADWLDLLEADPRLPRTLLPEDWPADRSLARYRELRIQLRPRADQDFRNQVAPNTP